MHSWINHAVQVVQHFLATGQGDLLRTGQFASEAIRQGQIDIIINIGVYEFIYLCIGRHRFYRSNPES